jgi:23S rRNA (guanosine2251-2'-O)-methyltransferase
MLVFGKNVAKDLLLNGVNINKIYLQDGFDDKSILSLIEKSNYKVEYKQKKEIDNLANGLHQGIIVSIPDYQYHNINSIFENNEDVVLILDHIEDPHNFGAIIRTCEAAGIHSIIISQDRQVPINSTVMKTSAGTLYNMNIVIVNSIANSIDILKDNGFWIVGTSLDNSEDYRNIDYSGKIAIVMGNEGKGISNLVAKKCDYLAKIPMYGKTNSLNVSVATGIMIYEVIRNRK